MKMRFKRFLSGFMAVATLASVIVQPVTVSASELEPEPTSFEDCPGRGVLGTGCDKWVL